jgi:hypothetical protein
MNPEKGEKGEKYLKRLDPKKLFTRRYTWMK